MQVSSAQRPTACCAHLRVSVPPVLQANMHALASELERVKTELNDGTAMMGIEMERWRQQADATSTQVLLHHVRGMFCWAAGHAMLAICYFLYGCVKLQCQCTAMPGT